jgi:DNA transformation protein
MSRNNSFKDYIVEDVLGHIKGITSKGMFGGHGIYLDKIIIGIIVEGELYLKADKELVAKYKKEGLYPFTYEGHKGKIYEMSYMSVPIEILEDREAIQARIYESFKISRESKKAKK